MNQVETVALWVGVVAGIASGVLAVVAIWFAWAVNSRATEVNDKIIQSLERIESSVSQQTDDTRNLIKAAWDKMLSGVGIADHGDHLERQSAAAEISSGLSEEIHAELAAPVEGEARAGGSELGSTQADRVGVLLTSIEERLEAQARALSLNTGRLSEDVERMLATLRELRPESVALLLDIQSRHLTSGQYFGLIRDASPAVRRATQDLRRAGLLVPLRAFSPTGRGPLVYWFPYHATGLLRAALQLIPAPPEDVFAAVRGDLASVKYLPQDLGA